MMHLLCEDHFELQDTDRICGITSLCHDSDRANPPMRDQKQREMICTIGAPSSLEKRF